MTNRFTILLIIATLACFSCGEKDKAELLEYDYRLFKDTPVWALAQAVERQDVDEIRRILKDGDIEINYQEPKFGNTLLMLAVLNEQYNSCEALLVLGADPNVHNTFSGSTALIEAATIASHDGDNTPFLKLLLTHGADPNEAETGARKPENTTRWSPLLVTCRDLKQGPSPLEKVKTLVEAGADINYENEFHQFPLAEALMLKHYDVAWYLLQKGANYEKVFVDQSKFQDQGRTLYIADLLRTHLLPLNSNDHAIKMEIVAFLKTKGIDYRKIPIPDFVIRQAKAEHPGNWKEYLDIY